MGLWEGVGKNSTCVGSMKGIMELLYWKRVVWPWLPAQDVRPFLCRQV